VTQPPVFLSRHHR